MRAVTLRILALGAVAPLLLAQTALTPAAPETKPVTSESLRSAPKTERAVSAPAALEIKPVASAPKRSVLKIKRAVSAPNSFTSAPKPATAKSNRSTPASKPLAPAPKSAVSEPKPAASVPAQAAPGARALKANLNTTQPVQLRLATATPQVLAGVHLPVLLPNTPEFRAGVRVYPSPDSYAATLSSLGATIEVFGSRLASRLSPYAEKLAAQRLKPDAAGYVFTDTEYGPGLTFSRYGNAYSIRVTCDVPETDKRCTKHDFLTGLADSMAMFGGTPEGGH